MFDGSDSTFALINGLNTVTWTPDSFIPIGRNISVRSYGSPGTISINGSLVGSYDGSGLTTFNYGGQLNNMTLANTGGNWAYSRILIDDAVLVDSGAQWDTSEIWSDGGTGSTQTGYAWSKAFNGDVNSAVENCAMPNSPGALDWTGSIDTTGKTVTLYIGRKLIIHLPRTYLSITSV